LSGKRKKIGSKWSIERERSKETMKLKVQEDREYR
jgi:hypothetical protein